MDNPTTNAELTATIEQLRKENDVLKKAAEEAVHANLMKSAFLANMSHDIRTPMNAIVGFADILLYAQNDEEREEYVNVIKSNSNILMRLINDILDLSKMEAGEMSYHMEDIDVIKLIHDAVATTSCGLNGKDILIRTDIPYTKVMIRFDRHRFMQILNNYLSNAVKYTKQGTITIGVTCESNGIKLWVKDTGMGVAADKQDRVFGRFQKLDTVAQGTGLGLSICRMITENMGGKVGFDSKEGEGSTFWAWLPLPVESKEIGKSTRDLPILLVEDEETNVRLAQVLLRGYKVVHAPNGAEAVQLMKEQKFSLVLMDLRMPVLGGLEATKQIREFDKETPIIATTAYSSREDYALMAGCNGFICKPLLRDELMAVIGKYID